MDQLAWIINSVWRLGYSPRDFAKSPHGLGRIPLDERLIVGETSRRSMGLPTCYHAGWNILLAIRWPDGRR